MPYFVVAVSAGNNGKDSLGNKQYGSIGTPGIEPSVITVGAVNTSGTDCRSDDTVATYSSRGPTRGYQTLANGARKYDNLIKPDLVAPGNKLIGASFSNNKPVTDFPDPKTGTSTAADQQLMYLSGTSMSAPIVTGAAALLLNTNPALKPNLVKAILMYSAEPMKNANMFEQSVGALNIDGAVRLARLVKNPLPTTNGSAMLNGSLPSSQTSTISGQTITWGKGVITNFGFLYGNDLMNYYQGMYGNSVLVYDGTPFANGNLTKSTTLTYESMNLYQGAIKINGNGVLVSDGTLFTSADAMGGSPTPFVNGQGVLVADGVLVSDGGANAVSTGLGDNQPQCRRLPRLARRL